MRPRFKVEALALEAVVETGYSFLGSDEVYAVFRDDGVDDRVTPTLEGMDDGDHAELPAPVCVTPLPRCDDGRTDLAFDVALFESDGGRPVPYAPGSHAYFEHGTHADDDHIGRAYVGYPRADLLALLPVPGTSVLRSVEVGGCADGHDVCGSARSALYRLWYRVTRLSDLVEGPAVLDAR